MKKKNHCLFLVTCIASILFSCSSAPKVGETESDAETVYRQGLYFLEKDDYNNAEAKFMKVISDFSFSKYEPYATVALGDTYFEKEEFASAITVYETFLKRHPKHELAPEAELHKANSYFAQRPSDFFLLPDPSEKDIQEVYTATALYREFLKKYPDDKNADECRENLAKAEAILIEKDLRIAEFYGKKKKCAGVNLRLKHIFDNYEVSSPKALARIDKLKQKCPAETALDYQKPITEEAINQESSENASKIENNTQEQTAPQEGDSSASEAK